MEELAGGTFAVKHQDRVGLESLEGQNLGFQRKKFPVCNKYIVKFIEGAGRVGACEGGIRVVGDNQIHLPLFKQPCTADGSLVGNLDVDMGVLPVKLIQVGNQVVAAYGVAGADAQLAASKGAGFQKLVFALAD